MSNSPFPVEWRPDKVGFIIQPGIWDGGRCWLLKSAGSDPTEEVLDMMRRHTKASGEPHIVKKSESWLCYGKPEFRQAVVSFVQGFRQEAELNSDFLSAK
jgi:hypothetical protein